MADEQSVILLDTNVVSYRYSQRSQYEPFRKYVEGHVPAISFITLGECLRGAMYAEWGEKKMAEYEAHLRKYLLIPATKQLAEKYAELSAYCRKKGLCFSDENDVWIAATALFYGIPILTNDGVFRMIEGLEVLPEQDP